MTVSIVDPMIFHGFNMFQLWISRAPRTPRLFPERESEIDEEVDPGKTELVTVSSVSHFTDCFL